MDGTSFANFFRVARSLTGSVKRVYNIQLQKGNPKILARRGFNGLLCTALVKFSESRQVIRNMRLKVADISELLNGVDDGGGQQNVSLQTIFISTNGDYHA